MSTPSKTLAKRKGRANQGSVQPKVLTAWKSFAGVWRDNPDFDAFLQEIKNARCEADQATKQP